MSWVKENKMPKNTKAVTESRFEYKGYPCVVIFQPMGHRCGYVGLSRKDKHYNEEYGKIEIECHGGLTYARDYLINEERDGKTIHGKKWWIGFDCAHWQDGIDNEALEKYGMEPIRVRYEYPAKTKEYCEEECKRIVDQLED